MRAALADAKLAPGDIDYVNLHGTATPSNDASEDRAVSARVRHRDAVQLDQGRDRPHARRGRRRSRRRSACWRCAKGCCRRGSTCSSPIRRCTLNYLHRNAQAPLRAVLSNSFGFGGTNASLILGKAA